MFRLPTTATAPFCPSEVRGTVAVPTDLPFAKKLLRFLGPGLLVSVGYMDPGNWATDIQAGSQYGYQLLFVVVLSSIAAMMLQSLSMRLGIVTGEDLARHTARAYRPWAAKCMWILAELSIVACDLAEVLGSALAFKLLFDLSLPAGIALTAFDTVIVLGLQGKGFRQVEAIVLGLIATVGLCFAVQLIMAPPDWRALGSGLVPSLHVLQDKDALYLAIGILGATIMPHNLYLHSSIVQTRVVKRDDASIAEAIHLSRFDTIGSLALALLINAAILVLAAAAFHGNGHTDIADIESAWQLLTPITGGAAAAICFAVALFASGQSSTFTGTIAGQIIFEGFLGVKIPCWQRRLITRGLALVPAFIGVMVLGEHAVGRMLVLSQVVLSMQLPFAMYPLLRFTGDTNRMGHFANTPVMVVLSWLLFVAISAANVWLVMDVFGLSLSVFECHH
jgi:manganese transport protein